MRTLTRIFPIFLLVTVIYSWSSPNAVGEDLVLIVNSDNPISKITKEQVSDFFLKKDRQWADGSPVRFIDRQDNCREREVFLKQILRKTGREVDMHWIGQKLYSGNFAPQQVNSEIMAASLVARFKGAISYVSPSFAGAKGVKKVEIVGAE